MWPQHTHSLPLCWQSSELLMIEAAVGVDWRSGLNEDQLQDSSETSALLIPWGLA